MTISINTKDTGETTVHIIAATLAEAIQQLDRARAALWELDEAPQPLGAATGGMPTAAELEQITTLLAPTTDETLIPQEQPSDPALPSPPTATQLQNSATPSLPSILSLPPPPPSTNDAQKSPPLANNSSAKIGHAPPLGSSTAGQQNAPPLIFAPASTP